MRVEIEAEEKNGRCHGSGGTAEGVRVGQNDEKGQGVQIDPETPMQEILEVGVRKLDLATHHLQETWSVSTCMTTRGSKTATAK